MYRYWQIRIETLSHLLNIASYFQPGVSHEYTQHLSLLDVPKTKLDAKLIYERVFEFIWFDIKFQWFSKYFVLLVYCIMLNWWILDTCKLYKFIWIEITKGQFNFRIGTVSLDLDFLIIQLYWSEFKNKSIIRCNQIDIDSNN